MVWADGHRIGGYGIEGDPLGQGGFGITYKARHTLFDELVVIKTPNAGLKNDPEYSKYIDRFIQEGRRLRQLSENPHPNIVRIRDLFEERGTYCLVMDFVPGKSLFNLVRERGALVEVEAVEYIRQIGQALIFLHEAGLVHRDAHPGNIMIKNNGKAVLIDFGIAAEIAPTVKSSKHFANVGFAPYEQMQGSGQPTVDIYCLAASLYYAVTGQVSASSLERKLNKVRLVPPKQLRSISDELNRAIIKGMELEAKNRSHSMLNWLELLKVNLDYQVKTIRIPGINPLPPISSDPISVSRVIPWEWLTVHLLVWINLSCILLYKAGWVEYIFMLFGLAAPIFSNNGKKASSNKKEAFFLSISCVICLIFIILGIHAHFSSFWSLVFRVISLIFLVVNMFIVNSIPLDSAYVILIKSFSKFNTFLILNATYLLGIALGWWVNQIFG